MTQRTMTDIFKTYRRGDRLDDAELEMLHDQMRTIARTTADFGDIFNLASTYAGQVERDCAGFLASRRERAKRAEIVRRAASADQ